MRKMHLPTKPLLLGFLIALVGAIVANAIGMPIPWLLGALIPTVIVRVNGVKVCSHSFFRKCGQWLIGISLGLYFTPMTIGILKTLILPIFISCLFVLLLGLSGSWILYKIGGVDYKTAFFSSTIGGASEMVVLAERNQANQQLTASSHSLRILIVTISIPLAYQLLNIHGNAAENTYLTATFSYQGLIALLASTFIIGVLFAKIRIPNAFILGSIVVTGLLTANDIHLSNIPPTLQHLSQILIGWSLGSTYQPGFFKQAPRFLVSVVVMVLFYFVGTILFVWLMLFFVDIYFPTAILALSPGGIAEMAITAKVLLLGAPIVTSYQVCRLIFVLLSSEPLFRAITHYQQKKRLRQGN